MYGQMDGWVCMYTYLCIYACSEIFIQIYTSCMYKGIIMYKCMHVCTHTCLIYQCMRANMYVCM